MKVSIKHVTLAGALLTLLLGCAEQIRPISLTAIQTDTRRPGQEQRTEIGTVMLTWVDGFAAPGFTAAQTFQPPSTLGTAWPAVPVGSQWRAFAELEDGNYLCDALIPVGFITGLGSPILGSDRRYCMVVSPDGVGVGWAGAILSVIGEIGPSIARGCSCRGIFTLRERSEASWFIMARRRMWRGSNIGSMWGMSHVLLFTRT